jgi:hypothetical protein
VIIADRVTISIGQDPRLVAEAVLAVFGPAGAREVARELERIMCELGGAAAHGGSIS